MALPPAGALLHPAADPGAVPGAPRGGRAGKRRHLLQATDQTQGEGAVRQYLGN